MTDEQTTLKDLKSTFSVPSGLEICRAATLDSLSDHFEDAEWIKANFSNLVEEIQSDAYRRYLAKERPAAIKSFRLVLGQLLPEDANAEHLFKVLEDNFWALDKFFLGLTNGRRPRAGKAFENVIKTLFDTLNYPYTPQPIINGQPDFLLPSEEHFRNNAMDCIIFTVKRTLRERWRQITTEGTQGHLFFLATIDEGISVNNLAEMRRNRIYLVAPKAIKQRCYPDENNVIAFEDFFKHHLDPAMERWRDNGIIE